MSNTGTPVRIAVLEAGLIGTEHVRFIQALGSTQLVAISDVSLAAEGLAQQVGVPFFTDYRQLIEDIRPEAAIVALPNALHVPAALSCVRQGIPANQGKRAKLVAINGFWFVRKHCRRFMCGEIESVQAMASNALRGFPVEDTAALIVRFQSGAVGSMVLSEAVPSPWAWDLASGQAPYFPFTPADCYYLGGTAASLAVPSMELWWHGGDGDWRDPLVHSRLPTEKSIRYFNQLVHLVDIVRRGVKPLCDARNELLTLAATLTVKIAAREGRMVAAAEFDSGRHEGESANKPNPPRRLC
jgi:predicted dehydrogenase